MIPKLHFLYHAVRLRYSYQHHYRYCVDDTGEDVQLLVDASGGTETGLGENSDDTSTANHDGEGRDITDISMRVSSEF